MAGDSFYEAYVEVIPTAKGFERSLSKQIDGPVGSVGTSAGTRAGGTFVAGFGKMLPLLGGVLAAAGVGNIIADAITNGSDLQQAQGAVEDVYGELGADAIRAFAEGGARTVGQSMTDILSQSSILGLVGQSAGLAGEDLTNFSKSLITLGADLSAFAGTSPEEAVQAILAGFRGEADPLEKYGVFLNDAALRQQALTMGIYDGNGALTSQQRILAVNALLYETTAAQQGKFAAESGTLAGRQAQVAAGFENVSAKIGEAFLPVMEQLLGAVQDEVLPALEDFAAWLAEPSTQEAIGNFAQGISDLVGKLALGAQQIDTFFTDMNANEDLWFSDLGGKLALGAEQWGEFFRVVGEKFGLGAQQIGDFFTGVGEWFQYWADRLALGQSQVFGFFGAIGGKFALGAQQIGDFSRTVGQKVGEAVGFFQELPSRIGAAIGGLGSQLFNAGRSIVSRFADGIRSMIGAVGNAVGGVMDFVAGFFPNSPAKWGPLSGSGWTALKSAGEAISNQFAQGIQSDYGRVRSATSGLASAAVPSLSLAGASIDGTLEIGGDGLARIIDGRFIAGQAAAARNDDAGRRVRP